MKKKFLIIIAIITFLLLGFILVIVNAFVGNPISAAIATSKIKSYVKETYPQLDLQIPKTSYNFKDGSYYSRVFSKTSEDTNFIIRYHHNRISDEFEYEVANHFTTYRRLTTEFDIAVTQLLEKEFPYETSMVIADFFSKDDEEMKKSLTLDMPFDITDPPLSASLSVYVYSDDLSYENTSVKLLELHSLMKKHNIPIDYYSLILEEKTEDGSFPGKSLYLFDFPSSEIYSKDLEERIKLHQQVKDKEGEKIKNEEIQQSEELFNKNK